MSSSRKLDQQTFPQSRVSNEIVASPIVESSKVEVARRPRESGWSFLSGIQSRWNGLDLDHCGSY